MSSEVVVDFEAMALQEKNKKVSLADLPDDILQKICNFRKLRPGLKLRLNKRMEQRIHSLFETIHFDIHSPYSCTLIVNSTQLWVHFDAAGAATLARALNRWSSSADNVRTVEITEHAKPEEVFIIAIIYALSLSVIYALCQFNTDLLRIVNNRDGKDRERQQQYFSRAPCRPRKFPYIDFATLLVMSVNIREVFIDFICSSLDAMDLCIFFKALVKGDCKLESFSAMINKDVGKAFVKAAFQTFYYQQDSNTTITYHSALSMTKVYSKNEHFPLDQIFFNGNLKTEIDDNHISFKKISDEEKARLEHELFEIHLNHTYQKPC